MITKLYGKYFQKSKSFLYPALGIKRGKFVPTGTYLSIEGLVGAEDMKLICSFKESDTQEFKSFEELMLLTNPLFVEKMKIKDASFYIFDLETYKSDYFYFLLGKYSKLSKVLKRAIKTYYGEKSAEYSFIDTYLYPEKYFTLYSKLLDIEVDTLENLGELCDPFDLEKETLKISREDLELLTKVQ